MKECIVKLLKDCFNSSTITLLETIRKAIADTYHRKVTIICDD